MFTGLVADLGTVASVDGRGDAARLRVETRLGGELRPGDSVAVNGVCLTALAPDAAPSRPTSSPRRSAARRSVPWPPGTRSTSSSPSGPPTASVATWSSDTSTGSAR